jgi:hypothetical protein
MTSCGISSARRWCRRRLSGCSVVEACDHLGAQVSNNQGKYCEVRETDIAPVIGVIQDFKIHFTLVRYDFMANAL